MLKKIFKYLLVLVLLLVIFPKNLFAQTDALNSQTEYLYGKVTSILEEGTIDISGQSQDYQKLNILVTKGSLKGETIEYDNGTIPTSSVVMYKVGDLVNLSYYKDEDGNQNFQITDYVRVNGIITLTILFVVVAVFIGSKKGFYSLVGMVISFIVIFAFVLPQIKTGNDPVITAILGCIFIIPITFYLAHGFNRKTTVAILGTIIALIITALLSSWAVNITHLTGLSTEEAAFLGTTEFNLKGILLAGIIIGTLGVLDDVTISQAAVVYELKDIKQDMKPFELFKRAMRVGKDHIASMVNTLVLAYTGASLPLLLLFLENPRSYEDILNMEPVATEIVRTLVGSIGLVLAVPLTTVIAAWMKDKNENSVKTNFPL